jgi:hypothetical protein
MISPRTRSSGAPRSPPQPQRAGGGGSGSAAAAGGARGAVGGGGERVLVAALPSELRVPLLWALLVVLSTQAPPPSTITTDFDGQQLR